ncbi:MAG: type II toxin-antitoxin system VapC family toxin [Acetobacteraceae bacterium]
MTVFVDASAMIAMMVGESSADALADRLEAGSVRLCSAISLWETMAGLCRSYFYSVASAGAEVQSFRDLNDLRLVVIGERELELASQAYAEFGRGRHPASLNMGDCFAYAAAKANHAALLFTGNDFAKTDIRAA